VTATVSPTEGESRGDFPIRQDNGKRRKINGLARRWGGAEWRNGGPVTGTRDGNRNRSAAAPPSAQAGGARDVGVFVFFFLLPLFSFFFPFFSPLPFLPIFLPPAAVPSAMIYGDGADGLPPVFTFITCKPFTDAVH